MVDQVNSTLVKAQVQQASKKLEIGWIGLLFGDATEKPGNVAGAALFLCIVALVVVLIWAPESSTFPKRETVTLFGTMATGALGFLFGRITS